MRGSVLRLRKLSGEGEFMIGRSLFTETGKRQAKVVVRWLIAG